MEGFIYFSLWDRFVQIRASMQVAKYKEIYRLLAVHFQGIFGYTEPGMTWKRERRLWNSETTTTATPWYTGLRSATLPSSQLSQLSCSSP
jgi:hypothetical protein